MTELSSSMADYHRVHHHHELKPSWVLTVITQAALCLALFAAFNIGRPHSDDGSKGRREPFDLYFLSVRGGEWPLKQQIHLLQTMEKAVRIFKAKFVVNLGELGEDDPLMQNATLHFPLLKIPWYTTAALHGHVTKNFVKSIKLPHEQVLDVISVDTRPFQDFFHVGGLNASGEDQLTWMQRTLALTNSKWRIVVGFDPVIACGEDNAKGTKKFYEPLRELFFKYGVNAYMSQWECTGYHYHDGGIVYFGHQRRADNNTNGIGGILNGFLLHRVGPLEIETYYIDSVSEVVSKSVVLRQRGRGAM